MGEEREKRRDGVRRGEELGRGQDHDLSENSHTKVYREVRTHTAEGKSGVCCFSWEE